MRAQQDFMADGRAIYIFVALTCNLQRIKSGIERVGDRSVRLAAFDQSGLIDQSAEEARTPLFRELAKDGSGKEARQSRNLRCAINE